jgi:hypothetical protein
VPKSELTEAIAVLQNHYKSQRPQEKDHPLVERNEEAIAAAALANKGGINIIGSKSILS